MTDTVAVGFFDGVHRGHQALLRGANRVLTFRNHPLSVLCPARAPRLLMSSDERIARLRAHGIREVVALEFTPDFASMTPEAFATSFLAGARVQCGANWTFGAKGGGDAGFLRARGFEVRVVPNVLYKGERISSTRIRAALEKGEVSDARAMLGHDFCVSGTRFVGKGEGHRLGFPTVNVRPENLFLRLPHGVYLVAVGGRKALANYGIAPTFGARAWQKPVFELHFLMPEEPPLPDDGATVSFSLLRFIRPERAFASAEDLKAQIARDVDSVAPFFS